MDVINFIPALVWMLAFPVCFSLCDKFDKHVKNHTERYNAAGNGATMYMIGIVMFWMLGIILTVS